MQQYIDGTVLAELLESGYRNLKKNMDTVNDLNVFPVPDGDTGTNMAKTLGGGLHSTPTDIKSAGKYMQQLSRSVLMSARGNSGVIFSQFIYGLGEGLAGKDEIAPSDLAYAFERATDAAYKAIVTPAEGTMLTVIREAAEFLNARKDDHDDFRSCIAALLECMRDTLARTPDMLPVLKEAGVVDSGGAGLICIFEGIYAALCGESVEDTPDLADLLSGAGEGSADFGPDSVLQYGYCTEFILQLMNYKTDIDKFDLDKFTEPLKELGNSIVSVVNGDIVKIHIHSFTPEKVLGYAREFGEFVTVKIENMSVQHSETIAAAPKKEHQKYAIVAVASGEGIVEYFYNIGAHFVIDGGQTDNPPVDAFISAFSRFDAEHIIVLPNNSNVILTAGQAAELYTDADVRVIPTRSVVEGYSALSMMNLWCDTVEELIDDMTCGLDNVTSASVTTATRDTVMNGVEVKKDKYIGISGKEIINCGDDKVDIAAGLIARINADSPKEVITVFCGADVTPGDSERLESILAENYPLADIGFIDGKQEVYSFIISLE